MLDLVIHCYGYSELMYQLLNAIAFFRNSAFFTSVITLSCLLSGLYYTLSIAAGGNFRSNIQSAILMIGFVNAMLMPTTKMVIEDHVEKHKTTVVDNIPLAFALPIGMIETYGHLLTVGFEQAFALGESAQDYYEHGTIFGARLSKEISQSKIRKPENAANMQRFIKRCVVVPAMIGSPFSKEELKATDNIWQLLRQRTGNIRMVELFIGGTNQAVTCKDAMYYFEDNVFTPETETLLHLLAKKFNFIRKGDGGMGPLMEANNYMRKSIKSTYAGVANVEELIKQNMMINALDSFRAGNFAVTQARMQHEAGGLLSGDLTDTLLPSAHSLFKMIVYALFIPILPLIVIAGGFKKYQYWLVAALSLAFWPPLYAILNMVIGVAYDPAEIVSYSVWSTEKDKFDSIATMAMTLQGIIPFLAIWVTQMGMGGLMHLAGNIMANTQGAVSAGAAIQSTGSMSYDNINVGNMQYANNSAFKTDFNRSYVDGASSTEMTDGTHLKVTAGGNKILTGGAGHTSSSGEATFRAEDGINTNLNYGSSEAQTQLDRDQRDYSESLSNSSSKSAAYITNFAQHERTNNGYNIDTSTEEGQALKQALDYAHTISDGDTTMMERNLEAFAEGSVGGGFDIGVVSLKGSTGARASFSDRYQSTASEEQRIADSEEMAKNMNTVIRAMQNNAYSNEKGHDQTLNDEFRKSYQETTQLGQTVTKSQEEVDTYNEALNYAETHGATSSQDLYQEVLENYARRNDLSLEDAKRDVDQRTPEVMATFNDMTKSKSDEILAQVRAKRAQVSNKNELDAFSNTHQVSKDVHTEVQQLAQQDGFNSSTIKEEIAKSKNTNQNQYEDLTQKANQEYKNSEDLLNNKRKNSPEPPSEQPSAYSEVTGPFDWDDNTRTLHGENKKKS